VRELEDHSAGLRAVRLRAAAIQPPLGADDQRRFQGKCAVVMSADVFRWFVPYGSSFRPSRFWQVVLIRMWWSHAG
jgi:hypothetical protein